MNAIEDNSFTQSLANLRRLCPNPKAILCISAHWMTEGTWVTQMARPKTIHDFYGFPQTLFDIQYPAPGHPELADHIIKTIAPPDIHGDSEMWGLDHGTWSVLRHMYPDAETPVMQLSLYMAMSPEYHYRLGEKLRKLRDQGVLIVGSGNIVHNLKLLQWGADAKPYDWAIEFDEWVKAKISAGDHNAIIQEARKSEPGMLSIPTLEHWLPLLYILGASDKNDKLTFEFEEIHNSSISMRCVSFVPN